MSCRWPVTTYFALTYQRTGRSTRLEISYRGDTGEIQGRYRGDIGGAPMLRTYAPSRSYTSSRWLPSEATTWLGLGLGLGLGSGSALGLGLGLGLGLLGFS